MNVYIEIEIEEATFHYKKLCRVTVASFYIQFFQKT